MSEAASAPEQKAGIRPHRVNVRFSAEEYGHLWQQCRIVNRGPANFLRCAAMGIKLAPVPRFPEEVQRALKSLGGNLNQLAHQANLGRVDKSEVEALRAEVSRLLSAVLG